MSPSAVKTSHDQSTQDAVRAMSGGVGSAERLAIPVLEVADLAVSFDNSWWTTYPGSQWRQYDAVSSANTGSCW